MKCLLQNDFGIYYIRIRLNKKAIDYFARYEINKSLYTKDYQDALRKATFIYNKYQNILELIRMNILSAGKIQEIVDSYISETLEQDKRERIENGCSSIVYAPARDSDEDNTLMCKSVLEDYIYEYKKDLANSRIDVISDKAKELLSNINIELDVQNLSHREFMFELLKGEIVMLEELHDRFNGNFVSNRNTKLFHNVALKSKEDKKNKTYKDTLQTFKKYYDTQTITDDTKKDTYSVLERLLIIVGPDSIMGDTDLNNLLDIQRKIERLPNTNKKPYNTMTFEEIISIKHIPDEDIISANRVQGYIKHIKKFFAFCYQHQLISFDPSSSLSIKVRNDNKDPFNDIEIKSLLTIINNISDVKRYLYLCYIYSGVRREELYNSDILISPNGIPYFNIKQGKSEYSIRKVPLHKKLIEYGITNELLQKAKNTISLDNLGRQFNERIKVKVTDSSRKTLHSLRHTFATKLKIADVDDNTVKDLMGHSKQDILNKVYARNVTNFEKLRDTINLLDFGC